MEIHYAKSWFRADKVVTDPWAVKKAKVAYDRRKLHTVIAGPMEKPRAFIEFNMGYVGVGFLDQLLREYLSYSFEEVQPRRLFLTMATYREFCGESDQVKKGTTYFFKQNGDVVVVDEEFPNGAKKRHETKSDVSDNWEDYPAFGNYESLLRIERRIVK